MDMIQKKMIVVICNFSPHVHLPFSVHALDVLNLVPRGTVCMSAVACIKQHVLVPRVWAKLILWV